MSTTARVNDQSTDDEVISTVIPAETLLSSPEDDPNIGASLQPLELDEAEHDNSENDYPTGAKFYLICISMALILILDGLDSNILATALPAITNDFHAIADLGWYSSAYRLTACSSQFLYGKLYKIYPIKTLFLLSTLIFLMGSIICATAPSSFVFILGRAVTGVASAGIITGIFTIIVNILPLHKRPLYTALYGALESVVIIVAPLLGGFLTQRVGWRWCFCKRRPEFLETCRTETNCALGITYR